MNHREHEMYLRILEGMTCKEGSIPSFMGCGRHRWRRYLDKNITDLSNLTPVQQ